MAIYARDPIRFALLVPQWTFPADEFIQVDPQFPHNGFGVKFRCFPHARNFFNEPIRNPRLFEKLVNLSPSKEFALAYVSLKDILSGVSVSGFKPLMVEPKTISLGVSVAGFAPLPRLVSVRR